MFSLVDFLYSAKSLSFNMVNNYTLVLTILTINVILIIVAFLIVLQSILHTEV